ncbi:MAG TPA: amino acid permease, partial [Candidatus Acidoferrales bacterium]|nr:amino acid permease [Candidatus Acidoferrales bacterium]
MKTHEEIGRAAGETGEGAAPPALRRELKFSHTTAIVIANMIGTGIFTTTGFLAGDLGRPSLVIGIWVAGAVIAVAGCLCYAEMGVNLPESGGEYIFLREAWGPLWGFLSGWISFFAGFSAPIAAAALAFSEYTAHFFPAFSVAGSDTGPQAAAWFHFGRGQWLAIGIVLLFSVINIVGLRLAANVQNVITSLKIGVLALFLGFAFALGHGDLHHFSQFASRTSTHSLPAQFAVSLIFVMFAYSGWNAATYVSGEIAKPERTIPAALVAGTLTVAAFYVLLNVAFIYALPLESMKGVVAVGAAAANALFGPRGGSLFSAMMSVGLLSCVSAMVIAGPRVYFAMAVDGCFFRTAARIHPRWGTPVYAILFQGFAAALMILTGNFESLVYYIGFALIFFAALAVAGMIRLRRRTGWKRLAAVNWGYPLAPILFIVASVWMLFYTASLRPKESGLGFLTLVVGAVMYLLLYYRKG